MPRGVRASRDGTASCTEVQSLRGGLAVEVELVIAVQLGVQDRRQVRQDEVGTYDSGLPVVVAVLRVGSQGGVPHIAVVEGLKRLQTWVGLEDLRDGRLLRPVDPEVGVVGLLDDGLGVQLPRGYPVEVLEHLLTTGVTQELDGVVLVGFDVPDALVL